MNMRVSLFLDLVNKTRGPAREAKRDILDLKRATRDLGRSTGGNDAARDMDRLARSAQRARREYVKMALEARKARRGMGAGGGLPGAVGAGGAGGPSILAGTRRMLAAGVSVYALKKGIDATVGSSVRFESAFADVQKKVNLPVGKSWEDLEKTITQTALKFGRSRAEIAGGFAEAGAADIPYEDMEAFVGLTTKAAVAWDMSAGEATQALAETRASMGWNMKQLDEYVDKVNYLGDTSAAKERDILEMFGRAGAAAGAENVPFDAALASLTALRSIGMREETSARFFNAFASKLRTATYLPKKAAAGFKMLGLSAKTVEKGMKTDAVGTMINFLERLEKSPDKAAAAIQIMGQEWWDETARMGRAVPEIIKNLKGLQSGAWVGSAQKNLNTELGTTQNHLAKLSTLAETVGDRLGKWALPGINSTVEQLIETMERLDKGDTWYQRQLKYYEERDRAYREEKGEPEPEPFDPQKKQDEINSWLDERGLGWLQPFSPRRAEREAPAETGADAARRGYDEGRQRARQENDSIVKEWSERSAYQRDANRAWGGDQPRPRSLQELDKKVRPILNRRLAEAEGKLARLRQGPHFDLSGPRTDNQLMSIGAGGIYQLGLGGGGPIYGAPGGKNSGDYVLPAPAAARAASGVQSALGNDMSSAGKQAMSSFAAGITAGGAQAVAAANAVVGQVNAALSRAGTGAGGNFGGRLSGSLHDGATGG